MAQNDIVSCRDSYTCCSSLKGHGHPMFYSLLQEMADLHSRKNHDYAGSDPLSNLKGSEEIGIPAWKGVLVRLMDKWARIKTFANKAELEVINESIYDTLMDNAVYSLLCVILLKEISNSKNQCGAKENPLYTF
jgi:hypothetical protein